jgi:hypothetical protein
MSGALIFREVYDKNGVTRHRWTSIAAPIFTQDREAISGLVPDYG